MALSEPFGAGPGFLIQRSPPCEFQWGAWTARGHDLERMGWQFERYTDFSARDPLGRVVRLAMRDPHTGMAGWATCPEEDLVHAVMIDRHSGIRYEGRSHDCPVFTVERMTAGNKHVLERSLTSFHPISMEPEVVQVQRFTMADLFARRAAPQEEIIVEPQTVASLLEEIKKLQAPELARIREANRRRDPTRHLEDQPVPTHEEVIPAQIITLRRVA